MSTSSIIMMLVGCGAVWGGAIVTICIALAADKKSQAQNGSQNLNG